MINAVGSRVKLAGVTFIFHIWKYVSFLIDDKSQPGRTAFPSVQKKDDEG